MAADRFNTMIRLPLDLAADVDAYAARMGISRNTAMIILLREQLRTIEVAEKERELVLKS